MMEIKFRAWNKNLNRSGGMIWNVAVLNGKYFDPYEMETQEYPIMQYTGLKDLKGVEIYKGDIIEYKTVYEWDKKLIKRAEVVFENGMFSPAGVIMDLSRSKIIGNIYENPELLEVN